ncbi:MAG: hypothetical protein RBQ97_03530 [Acholeplasma sp.]|jgi:hypothetical protein|nr:hypothetical protein [Acholeplasma sp.]NCC55682.1 hypothetical protein [Erysipelotrichia bacterium]
MQNSISIVLKNDKRVESQLFGASPLKHDVSGTFVFMIKLEELPITTLFGKEGYLFLYIDVLNEICHLILEKDVKMHHNFDGYPISFELSDDESDDFKLFGKPYALNIGLEKDEMLLIQFDPLIIENPPIYDTLDGFVYVVIKKGHARHKMYERAYLRIDRT